MSAFERVLLASDGSEGAAHAAGMAAELSEKLGSELHLVHAASIPAIYAAEAVPTAPNHWDRLSEFAEREARDVIEDEERKIREFGAKVAEVHPRVGRADEQISDVAESLPADLVVIGSRGFGRLKRALMGSVSDSVVRHAHCPVLVVRGKKKGAFFPTKVLLAVDGSKESEAAARLAATLVRETASELYVTHVVPTLFPGSYPYHHAMENHEALVEEARTKGRSFLEDRAKRIEEETGVGARTHLRLGEPGKEIVELADELDAGMVIVGSRGFGGLGRVLMGSVSEAVVRHARCPALIVRTQSEAG